MSAYKEIKTEFRNPASLIKALNDLGIGFDQAADLRKPDLPLYGYRGDERQERGSIVIRRAFVNKAWTHGGSNDIGFAWDGKQMNVLISQFDAGCTGNQVALNKIRQRYAYHEVQRQARAKGYNVRETTSSNGTISLVMVKR